MTPPVYKHTQVMWMLWLLMLLASAILVFTTWETADADARALIGMAVLCQLAVLAFLGRFTVEVHATHIQWQFGFFGRPRWKVSLSDIRSVEQTRSRWTEGWGIRVTSDGMLFNASGFGAVRLVLKNGRKLRLGNPDPGQLASLIAFRISSHGQPR